MQEAARGAQSTCAYGWMRAGQLRAAAQTQAAISACCWEPPWAGQSAVLTWIAAPRFEMIHVKPTQSAACAQLPLLHMYLLEEPAPVPPRKSEVFSQWKLKKNLIIPPVPVLKTLPAFHKMNRRKNFLSTSCLFFIYSFPPPKWDLCLSAVAAQLPLAKWDPRNRKQGQEFSSDFW